MKRQWLHTSGWLLAVALLVTSCAYYNTFHNARKKFAEAERDNRNRPSQAQQPSGGQPHAGTPAPAAVQSPDKYRKVIETCSKLLEFYPNSRWVDDALMLMGMSYYRLQDLPRAERKFAELMTIFPNSKHIVEAGVWKAHVLADQKNYLAATTLLQETLPKIRGSEEKASALFLLGSLFYEQKRWSDAADQFQASASLRQPRDQRLKAIYRLGLSRQQQENYESARDAFAVVARDSRDTTVAYDATVRRSRCEVALKNYDSAENILRTAQFDERYGAYTDAIPLELAALAVETGRIEDGIALYETYVAEHERSERRGLAFYRLALVHRDRRVDLAKSKMMLDSVAAAGAAKEITDSARAAADDISKGLLAFEAIQELRAAVDSLKLVVEQQQVKTASHPSDTTTLPLPVQQDTLVVPSVPADTTQSRKPEEQTAVNSPDTSHSARHDSLPVEPETRRDVTSQSADSILRALARHDSLRRDSSKSAAKPPAPGGAHLLAPGKKAAHDTLSAVTQLAEYRQLLQIAYLRAGEFYDQNLADPDSALRYYRLAASDTVDMESYWKANLYLATSLPLADSTLSPEARQCYENVVAAHDVPTEAANAARRALGLPEISRPLPPQKEALLTAEKAWLARSVTPDSAIRLYAAAVKMDTMADEAQIALFALADIYENALQQPDSAARIFDILMNRTPNAPWVHTLRLRTKPPDSSSIFLKSDEDLIGKKVSVETLLQPAAGDSSGWPPSEESLRRIRYRL